MVKKTICEKLVHFVLSTVIDAHALHCVSDPLRVKVQELRQAAVGRRQQSAPAVEAVTLWVAELLALPPGEVEG